MLGTIDKAGRVVVPREIRKQLGFVPGDVEITVRGNSAVIEQRASALREVNGHLLLPRGGGSLSGDELRALRLAGQR